MDLGFNSLEELYRRLEPALAVKESEFKRLDLDISKEDIWNYLSIKWSSSNNLLLHQMVSDILKLKDNEIIEFLNK